MILFLFLIPAALIVLGLWMIKEDHEGGGFSTIVGGLILLALLIIFPVQYIDNVTKLGEMEAFVSNIQAYERAVSQTSEVLSIKNSDLSKAFIPVEGSVEKVEVGKGTVERIKEARDAIIRYNIDLAVFKIKKANWLVGSLYPAIPENLKPIRIVD